MIEYAALALPILGWMLGARSEDSVNKKKEREELKRDLRSARHWLKKERDEAVQSFVDKEKELVEFKEKYSKLNNNCIYLSERNASLLFENITLAKEIQNLQDKKGESKRIEQLQVKLDIAKQREDLLLREKDRLSITVDSLTKQFTYLKYKYDELNVKWRTR